MRSLLLGNDIGKTNHLGLKYLRRHTTDRVYNISQEIVASDPVRDAYTERVRRDLNLEVRAVDLGQFAGGTTAACFWLSLAAGLAHVQWEVPGQALPVLAEVPALLAKVRETSLSDLDHKTTSVSLRESAVGKVAFFCGDICVKVLMLSCFRETFCE